MWKQEKSSKHRNNLRKLPLKLKTSDQKTNEFSGITLKNSNFWHFQIYLNSKTECRSSLTAHSFWMVFLRGYIQDPFCFALSTIQTNKEEMTLNHSVTSHYLNLKPKSELNIVNPVFGLIKLKLYSELNNKETLHWMVCDQVWRSKLGFFFIKIKR